MAQLDLTGHIRDFSGLPRSTALLREAGMRALLLHLRPAEAMPEHKAPGPITVQCLAGAVEFSVGNEIADLSEGSLLSVPADVTHSLTAQADSLLLITMCA